MSSRFTKLPLIVCENDARHCYAHLAPIGLPLAENAAGFRSSNTDLILELAEHEDSDTPPVDPGWCPQRI